jgi:DNA-directed RNA polymerase specialized sigma24 family protein
VPLEDALTGLPPVYQDVLAYLDAGCSHAEIAERVGIDPSAVEPLIRLAKAKLVRAQQQTFADAADGVQPESRRPDLEGDR